MKERVLFRKWIKSPCTVIAMFPDIPTGDDSIQMFEHIGQHGGGNYTLVMCKTVPAKPKEYADLKKELENRGYHLRVVRRR